MRKERNFRELTQGLETLGYHREEVAMAIAMALGGESLEGLEHLEAPERNRLTLAYAWVRTSLEEEEGE